jgi:membrane associated rhomboid family serine protease
MEATRYRIVYRGEVGLGFEHDEIRENLVRLTRWDAGKIEQLLASSDCIIKNDLAADAAERMLNALNNTGIICRKEAIPGANPGSALPAAATTIAVVGRAAIGSEEDADKKCPKCGVPRDEASCCPACGIIFAKFGLARAAAASPPVITTKAVSTHAATLQRSSKRRDDPLAKLEQGHPLGYYLGKLFLALILALLLRSLFKADLTLLIFLLLPLGFALYLGALSAVVERPFSDLLAEHRSLLPIPFAGQERNDATLPFATYGLILLHVLVYLVWQLRTPVEILEKSWFFPPLDSSAANLVFSAVVSLFFHTSGGAFLGGLFFLWIIGATLERRIGSGFLLGLYLLCGLLAAGVGVGVQQLFPGVTLPIVGAGGALAALLGVHAICSHRRTMTFPLPFFGLDALALGTPYQVRWSSLFIAGLFVFADLGTPVAAVGVGWGVLGLTILLGGFLSGLLAANLLGLGEKAGDEEDEAVPGSQVFTANAATLRRRLAANPDNPDLQVQLARVIAEEKLTDEARQLYRRAIIGRLSSKPKEAAEIYREFNLRHQEVFEPKLTLRLASLYLRQGDTGMAASVLSSVGDDERATPQELEKALYQYCVTIAKLGQLDEAYMTLKRFSDAFPESPLLLKLREVVYDAAQPEPG